MTGTYPLNSQGHEDVPMGQPSQLPGDTNTSQEEDDDEDEEEDTLELQVNTNDSTTEEETEPARAEPARARRDAQEVYRMEQEHRRAVDDSWNSPCAKTPT